MSIEAAEGVTTGISAEIALVLFKLRLQQTRSLLYCDARSHFPIMAHTRWRNEPCRDTEAGVDFERLAGVTHQA
ncbi:Hypothetical protein FKW44_022363 [Caligus rogercresseyi]|uniref:Uncharacterized protein n=1 Tax=Caligus rogercresseyi TaxID=217165 RepID=A0A7T8JWJ1_CALRO|nr:Hypothetical protein FKW44_022363 [Caligus rogercresseyi]